MSTEGKSWVNHELGPAAPPEVNARPDGTFELHWPEVRETVILSREELTELVRRANDVLMA